MMNSIIKKEKEEQLKELHIPSSSSVNTFSHPASTAHLISPESNPTLNGSLNNNPKANSSNNAITMDPNNTKDTLHVPNSNSNDISQPNGEPVGFYVPQPEVSRL